MWSSSLAAGTGWAAAEQQAAGGLSGLSGLSRALTVIPPPMHYPPGSPQSCPLQAPVDRGVRCLCAARLLRTVQWATER